ncbi:MAG: DsbC family protein [Gammaproteobacteria bacterium]|nr:DsbC family protein [Gammaproteobacteria bacterium]
MRAFGGIFLLGAALLLFAHNAIGQNESLRDRLNQSIVAASGNQLEILNIKPTPIATIYEVELNTGELLYSDASGQYLFAGDMYRATPDGLLNLSAATRQQAVLRKLADVPDGETIIFEPEGEVKATVSVFTDVDCGYCRQLHGEREQMLDYGIRLRYLAYPRGGENAESYDKMISVWCSDDRHRSLTQAKNGQNLPERDCDSPVLAHYKLGNELGIQGTPALIFPDGRLIPGYLEAPRMAAMLGIGE